MISFDFMVDRLADVVKQTGALGNLDVSAQLSGHDTGQMSDFDRMLQNILTVARPVFQSSEQLDQLRMQSVDTGIEAGLLPGFPDLRFQILLSFFYSFFDSRRMDAPVKNQFFQRESCDFASDRVETRQNDSFRRIVDDELDARERFERADVASFASDDTALHFVVWKIDDSDRVFCDMIRSAPLDCLSDELLGLFFCIGFRFGFDLTNHHGSFRSGFLLDFIHQDVLGFVVGKT